MSIDSEVLDLTTCVTAVSWLSNSTILIGQSGHLLLLRKSPNGQWTRAEKCKIFPSQNIYGFAISESLSVIVYGGKQYAILELTPSTQIIQLGEVCDWILDVRWLDADFAVLTAHGKLLKVNSSSGRIIRELACPDRSILYSGRIVHSRWDDLIVLSGTVHNQVMVWTSDGLCGRILSTLSGHKGIIFSVRYDEVTSTICSTSDDRTARLWKVRLSEGESVRESWSSASITLHLTLYGHKARVFQSVFLPSSLLATIGEDGGVMVWKENGECASQSWIQAGLLCTDYIVKPGSGTNLTIAAGGADGSLCLFPLHLPQLPVSHLSLDGRIARQVFLTADSHILVYCEGGHIFISSGSTWKPVYSSTLISSYCVLTLSPSRTLLAMATISGLISVFSVCGSDMSLLYSEQPADGKVFSLHWLSEKLLLACCPRGRLCLLSLPTFSSDCRLCVRDWFELAESKERWTTSAILVSTYLICGDRQGSLHLYTCLPNNSEVPSDKEGRKALWTVRRAHGKGVSCIVSTAGSGLMTCGRDGTIRKYLLRQDKLEPVLTHKLMMDWASHLLSCPSFGHLVLGFHSVYLCVWSILENRFLLKMKCWGGHRSWDVKLDSSETLSLAFIKDKTVHTYTAPLSSLALPIPLSGHHSKAVNACSIVKDEWIVSGGEDCTVRVCLLTGLRQVCCISSHLSSIRALCLLPASSLLVTAGGRAQLKLWSLSQTGDLSEICSHMLRCEDELTELPLDLPEVRYMALAAISLHDSCYRLYTAASDGIIRVFEVDGVSGQVKLIYSDESGIGKCMLQIACLQYRERTICITGSTDGRIVLREEAQEDMRVVGVLSLHSGGVNSLWISTLHTDRLMFASGGDDGVLILSLASLLEPVNLLQTLRLPHLHTCQITGVSGTGQYLASVGLDRRLCLLRYEMKESELTFCHLSTYISSIPDIHGLHIHQHEEDITAVVFGIGIERVRLNTNNLTFTDISAEQQSTTSTLLPDVADSLLDGCSKCTLREE